MVAAELGCSPSPMTRSAWVTVRLPGARTAPATRTRTRFHTGAVKQDRNTDSQAGRIVGGIDGGSEPSDAVGAIPVVESELCRRRKRLSGRTSTARPDL